MIESKIEKRHLKKYSHKNNIVYYINISDIDDLGYYPTPDAEGNLFFIIDNKKFYQRDVAYNVFSEDPEIMSHIFIPENDKIELHIINDYI